MKKYNGKELYKGLLFIKSMMSMNNVNRQKELDQTYALSVYVGEGAVADVVHQDSGFHSFGFAVEDKVSFGGKLLDGLTHQVEGSQRVLEPCMLRTGIYDRGQPQLLDTV